MESSCLERNFILAPQPWTFPLNTNLSLILSTFTHYSSITGSSFLPCEQDLACNWLSVPTVCPIFLDLSYFIGGQSILFLAEGGYNLSVRARTSNLKAALDLSLGWKHVKGTSATPPLPPSISFLIDVWLSHRFLHLPAGHCWTQVLTGLKITAQRKFVSWLWKGTIIGGVSFYCLRWGSYVMYIISWAMILTLELILQVIIIICMRVIHKNTFPVQ